MSKIRNKMVSVLQNCNEVGKASYGLGQVALNLSRELNALGCDARIWCVDRDDDIGWASSSSQLPRNKIRNFPIIGPRRLGLSAAMMKSAGGADGQFFHIVHQHGIWTGVSLATTRLHEKFGLPYIVAPHGSLEKWSLKRSRVKKWIAKTAYEWRNLKYASCLHATAEHEVSDFRDFGLDNPVALVRNGVSNDWIRSEGDGERFRRQFEVSFEKRILFYLSRITPKKGLLMLIKAIEAIGSDFGDWILVIAGTDEFGHKAEVASLVKCLDMEEKVKFVGPLFDQLKRDAFAAADLFILPSYSEGAPIVVLDSLAVGVPVITTKASGWRNLEDYNCGWEAEISHAGICECLQKAISLSREELLEMGERGRKLVKSKYTWSSSAQNLMKLYDWLLGRTDKPEFVITD